MARQVGSAEFVKLAGTELEPSAWFEVSQDRVNQFADATNDHQFIHVDEDKAKASPFGGTIAHGFLTLSLLTFLLDEQLVQPENTAVTLNYGSDKVRYLKPVRVGQRIRARQSVGDITEKNPGQWLVRLDVTVEIEGEDTPALVAEILFMHIVAA